MAINAFELELYNALLGFWDQTVTNIGTNADVLPDLFSYLPATGSAGANQQQIGEIFSKWHDGPENDRLKITLQFPDTSAHLPCIVIEPGAEEENTAVARFVGIDPDTSGTQKVQRQIGSTFTKTYAVGVYTFSADSTLYLYSWVKYAILLLGETFVTTGSSALSGRQMTTLGEALPDRVYVRYLDIRSEGVVDSAIQHLETVKSVSVQDLQNSIVVNVDAKSSG